LPLLFPQVAPYGLLFEQAIPAIPMARYWLAAISGIFILAKPYSRAQLQAGIIRQQFPRIGSDSLAPARLALRAVLRTVYPAPSQVHVLPATLERRFGSCVFGCSPSLV